MRIGLLQDLYNLDMRDLDSDLTSLVLLGYNLPNILHEKRACILVCRQILLGQNCLDILNTKHHLPLHHGILLLHRLCKVICLCCDHVPVLILSDRCGSVVPGEVSPVFLTHLLEVVSLLEVILLVVLELVVLVQLELALAHFEV